MKIFVVIAALSCSISVSGRELPPEYDDDDEEPLPRLEDIPDKYYDSLMQEMPELSQQLVELNARRDSPAYKEALRYRKEHPSDRNKDNTNSSNTSKQSGRRIYQTNPDVYGMRHWRHWFGNNYITKKVLFQNKDSFHKADCYWCGMNLSYYIPTTSICHDAFETSDYRLRGLQRFFRGKCFYTNPIYVHFRNDKKHPYLFYYGTFQAWKRFIYGSYVFNYTSIKDKFDKGKWGDRYFFDHGLSKKYYGQYIGGCFKRYLDVGKVYTQRGCKHYWPINTYSGSSAAHRFKKMEYVLRWKAEGCVSSNHASLTPFNRGISLFARYHVCVCSTRYCNRAANGARLSNIHLTVAVLLTCSFNIHLIWIN